MKMRQRSKMRPSIMLKGCAHVSNSLATSVCPAAAQDTRARTASNKQQADLTQFFFLRGQRSRVEIFGSRVLTKCTHKGIQRAGILTQTMLPFSSIASSTPTGKHPGFIHPFCGACMCTSCRSADTRGPFFFILSLRSTKQGTKPPQSHE